MILLFLATLEWIKKDLERGTEEEEKISVGVQAKLEVQSISSSSPPQILGADCTKIITQIAYRLHFRCCTYAWTVKEIRFPMALSHIKFLSESKEIVETSGRIESISVPSKEEMEEELHVGYQPWTWCSWWCPAIIAISWGDVGSRGAAGAWAMEKAVMGWWAGWGSGAVTGQPLK